MTIERLTTGDFIGRLPFQSGADRDGGGSCRCELQQVSARLSTCRGRVDCLPRVLRAADARRACGRSSDSRSQPCPSSSGNRIYGRGFAAGPSHLRQIRRYRGGQASWADDATYVNTIPAMKLRASETSTQYTLS